MYLKSFLSLFCLVTIFGCDNSVHNSSEEDGFVDYPLTSYLDIDVDSLGRLPENPYVVNVEKNGKHIIVVGTLHSRDTLDPLFISIEKLFNQFQPTVAINEGGKVTDSYLNRNNAIQKDGEVGLLKFLCDSLKIEMINGDAQEKDEFLMLSKAFSREEALFYYTSERFVLPLQHWATEEYDIDSLYKTEFIDGYLNSCGIKLNSEEKTFDYYRNHYKQYFKKDFHIEDLNSDDFITIKKQHHFSELARKSCNFRDRHLLELIEKELKQHDRIIVVFGGWHVLAIEPAVKQIINKSQ